MAIHTFLASQLSEDDSVRVPIGEWYDQVINWLDRELTGLFDLIEWPFDQAMALMENSNDQFFSVPRVATVVVLGLIAYVGGGIRRAVYVVGAASLLALMGDITWQQSMIMLYALFVVLIAVALWTGLATAVAMRFALDGEGRDGTRAVRRIETGWSLLHPFALMLPAVFFFGIGQTSSMILATFMVLPLAIRASVTAPASESNGTMHQLGQRIRTGTRAAAIPALMLLGIFAIMGMGGIGQFLFRSLSNQDPALSGHAMVAMWIVGFIAWVLLGPWKFDHLPRRQNASDEAEAEQAAVSEPVSA